VKYTPLAIIAELTHRCPLHCVYCSNPLEMEARSSELDTAQWASVFEQAAAMGVLHADFTGGEPLTRTDLVELVAHARCARLYVSLITSGIPLDDARLAALTAAGLDHIQLSFQDAEAGPADEFAGTVAHARKLELVRRIREHRLALTLNFVVHRRNLDRLEEMIALAESSGAQRVEIAHVQYYGWALKNRSALLPTRDQLDRSIEMVEAARSRLGSRLRIDFVLPDYHARYPKPCMGGWGRKMILITPAGDALPCHAARVLTGLEFPSVRDTSLRSIWENSSAFQAFRGDNWMPEPCASCERKRIDFGGCRCQAMLLTGDASATDPVCSLAPTHHLVIEALAEAGANSSMPPVPVESLVQPDWLYRTNPR
jgi:pyrroloquinoline quinone biosynthesis protein E